MNQGCEDSEARQISALRSTLNGRPIAARNAPKALNQARIYLPAGPMPLYLLAKSDRTVRAAKALIVAGEQIYQRDNDGLTALAHALQDGDLVAAKRGYLTDFQLARSRHFWADSSRSTQPQSG